MFGASCCHRGIRRRAAARPARAGMAGALATATLLALWPKCPLCVAAWIAAVSGVALPWWAVGLAKPILIGLGFGASAALIVLALYRHRTTPAELRP